MGLGPDGRSTLSVAVIGGNKELLELLLKNGASLTVADANGCTPVHHAASKVRFLLIPSELYIF
jgi:ankyrin repeat protein